MKAGPNIPGSDASSITIHSMWDDWSRILFRKGTPFGRFYAAMWRGPQRLHNSKPSSEAWPMPLAFHGRQLKGCKVGVRKASLHRLVNLQIAYLNFLHLGEPKSPPQHVCGRIALNEVQREMVERLCSLSESWSTYSTIVASEMGRTAAKQQKQEQILSQLTKLGLAAVVDTEKYKKNFRNSGSVVPLEAADRGSSVGHLKGSATCLAQEIIADRVKMEGSPIFDPLPFLDEVSAELFQHPFCQDISPESLSEPPPRVRIHAKFNEKVKLLKTLNQSGRLGFRHPSEVVAGHGNGLFCVPKNLEVDRLILDGRPANMLQQPPNRFIYTMASATSLLGIFLAEGEKLMMSGDDLSNYFYTFKVGYDRGTRNFLEWRIDTKLVKDFPGFPPHLADEPVVYACLCTLAMGDSAACEYAQTSHLSLGIHAGAVTSDGLLTLHGRTPRTDSISGLIIDDFIMMQKVPIDATHCKALEDRRASLHATYNKVGLEAHPSKGFSQEEKASFWGADVDGLRGLVRGSIPRAASLCWITFQVAELGVSTVGLLEMISGGFVALFGFRRRMMSLLDLIYSAQSGRCQDEIISLSGRLRDELYSLCLLCPLAVSDLRVPFCKSVYMVDASGWGEAVCEAPLEGDMVAEIHRHGLCRSSWTRLLSPYKAYLRSKGMLEVEEELPPGEECYKSHPVWDAAARCLQFKVRWKRKAKRDRHINIGEFRSFLHAERCAATDHGSVRVPIGGDSQVTAGAIIKGRSASHSLNRELRRSLPDVLGFGIYSCTGYVNTKINPADDPTRGAQLREPSCELPQWWTEAERGHFEHLDSFLHELNLSDNKVGGYPPLHVLHPKALQIFDPVCKPGSNKLHLKVKQKLAHRHAVKMKPSEQVGPWGKEVQELLESFGEEAFIFGHGHSWPPVQPGFLDLYSGRKGFAKACGRLGAAWILTVDYLDGPQFNLLDKEVRRKIERLIEAKVFLHVSGAPICASFSRAITPAVRSKEHPLGIPPVRESMVQRIRDGNSHASWIGKLIRMCLTLKIWYWFENPDSSFIWLHPALTNLPRKASQRCLRVDFCVYGTKWRKRTKFLTNGRLAGIRNFCRGGHKHIVLRGRAPGKKACWTKLAEPYPTKLCSYLAWAACADAGISRPEPEGLCCKCTSRRIGEATNPGPRRPRTLPRMEGDLERVELIRPETQAIGHRQWQGFLLWLRSFAGVDIADSLWAAPGLLGSMLAAYGKHMFECGKALFNFRHLVVFVQREHPSVRGHLQKAWDTITRWEEIEPVEHRRPVPVAMLEAMACLAYCWGWPHVCCVLLIAFFGCCRPGEVLKACRGHLVFPADIGEDVGPIFFRIQKPKPGRRGMGRVQHTKITNDSACLVLCRVLERLSSDAHIYPGSAAAFRTRWTKLMAGLAIPPSAGITPAGLRAGGTVHLYRHGTPIADILWVLRLKNIETLQHYLQEISTQITMVDLPAVCKDLVKAFSLYFPCVTSIHST
eukprot:Skav223835  [mRNA]  locus=scaffold1256:189550:193986:- [translate_table: standard]